ncbi:MAG: O-antigen ligase family protein [Chloroflexi bacterium]|nr:O-antigen ligase family protein [Chloroflexota bacterium]MCI0729501.1 O-antigen ligase family protein [Chloroflexota bacterium]
MSLPGTTITLVGYLFLLLPLWWVLGVEQFVWPVALAGIGLWEFAVRKARPVLTPTARWFFLFLVAQIISSFFIVERARYLSFGQTFLVYGASALLVLILPNRITGWRDIRFLLISLLIAMTVAAALGLLGMARLWQPSFMSAAGAILPEWIADTSYGGRIAFRTIGQEAWFFSLPYFRVNSFFLFATVYALALAITVPIALFAVERANKITKKALWGGIVLLLLVNLAATTGRTATIALFVGGVYQLAAVSPIRRWIRVGIVVGISVIVVTYLFEGQLLEQLYAAFLNARAGSLDARSIVYQETWQGFLDRPLFGWGTQRDIPGFALPAGSHSYYLAILYKYGLVGFAIFMGVWWALWRDTRPPAEMVAGHQREVATFLSYGRWIFIVFLISSTSTVLDLDATTMIITWLIFALLLSARRLYETGADRS